MMDFCRDAGLRKPDIIEKGLFLKVIFYKADAVQGAKNGGQKQPAEVNGRSSEILALIKENPYISRRELIGKLGINGSAVQKYIEKLKTSGTIERIGPEIFLRMAGRLMIDTEA